MSPVPTAGNRHRRGARQAGGEARIDDGDHDQAELGGDPAPEQGLDPAVPEPDAEEGVEEEDEARRKPRFSRRTVKGRAVGAHGEELVPKAEIDAEIDEGHPRDERSRGEDRPVIGGKDRRQEDREQTGDAEQHAVEQHAVLLFRLIGVRVPEVETRDLRRAQLGGEGDGLPRLEVQAEHVGAIALERLGAEAERRRHRGDAGSVELGPEHARIGERVTRRDQPAHDRL